MKTIRLRVLGAVLAFGALGLAPPAAAQDVDCTDRDNQTQMVMNECAAMEAQMADEAMAASFETALSLTLSQNAGTMNAAQNAFVVYRYLVCAFEADQAGGGSIGPLLYSLCMTRLTEQRTADLDLVGQP